MFNSSNLKIKKPVVIIGCPRSGTSLLFKILSSSKFLFSLHRESHNIWDSFYKIKQNEDKFQNDYLTNTDIDELVKQVLMNQFHKYSFNNYWFKYITKNSFLRRPLLREIGQLVAEFNILYKTLLFNEYRIVEKTPRTCFMVSFIDKLFEDCRFIYIKRDGRANISSLIEAWRSASVKERARSFSVNIPVNITGYSGKEWKYVIPPGWEDYINSSLEKVCAFQWISTNKAAIDGLKNIEKERKYLTSYEDLTDNTYETIKKICSFVEIPFSEDLKKLTTRPPVVAALSKPQKDKWKKNINLLETIYPMIELMMKELGYSLSN